MPTKLFAINKKSYRVGILDRHINRRGSGALKVAEPKASQHYQELVKVHKDWDADIQHAMNKTVAQYQLQLSSAKSSLQQKDRQYQQLIQKLQGQVHSLELSMASQVNFPSVGTSNSEKGLYDEVFNILPGTVDAFRGAATYNSQDQAFSFHKQVRFEDNSSSPNLKPDAGLHNILPSSQSIHNTILNLSSQPCASMLFHELILHNRT